MTTTRSNYAPQELDLYETPHWVTEQLLPYLGEGLPIWDPSAGNCQMSDVLVQDGHNVVTTDIVERDRELTGIFDFLSDQPKPFFDERLIIANPPYGHQNRTATRFVERALERSRRGVAMLLTAKFDSGSTRQHLFKNNRRFCRKVVLLDRIQWFAGPHTNTEDHAWFFWAADDAQKRTPTLEYVRNPYRASKAPVSRPKGL